MAKKEVETPIIYPCESLENIEKARKKFKKVFNKGNYIKVAVMMFSLAVIILSFVLVPNLFEKVIVDGEEVADKRGTYLMWGGLLFAILVVAIYSLVSSKLNKKSMDKYIAEYNKYFSEYVYEKDTFEVTPSDQRITYDEFNACNVYKDVCKIPHRNINNIVYKYETIKVADLAAQIQNVKQLVPVFVGKYMSTTNNYDSDDGIIIYYKAKESKNALPPTNNIYATVEDNDKFTIYSNNPDWKKTITKKVMDELNKLEVDNVLLDATVSIQKGKTFVLLGIDDSLMVLPFQDQFKFGPIQSFKEHIVTACDIILTAK